MTKMDKIYKLLGKDVSALNKLTSTNGRDGFFLYYYMALSSFSDFDTVRQHAAAGFRDDYCYEYRENEIALCNVHFYTRLTKDHEIVIAHIEMN